MEYINRANHEQTINQSDFLKISKFIEERYGLKLPEYKKYLIQSRLLKRMNALNIRTYKEYIEFLFDPKNVFEIQNMIDVVTTHKTDFYRENDHFEFIYNIFLPEFIKRNSQITIWSAGCSTGEEVYTLSFVLSEFIRKNNIDLHYTIYGSDVSQESIEQGIAGVYHNSKIIGIPLDVRNRYFLKNKNPEKKLVKVIPEIQKNVVFFKHNLLEKQDFITKKLDIVMCRNTLIYFARDTQELVLRNLIENIKMNGFLFIGHSESIFSMKLPVKLEKTTIFKKIE